MGLLLEDALDDPMLLSMAVERLREARATAHGSFLDAVLRVDRALEHLPDLETRIARYAATVKDQITVHVDEVRGFGIRHEGEGPPRELSVDIGEIVYNLRAALDYLVYALAWLDSGVHQPKTQLPIEDSCKVFEGRRNTDLKGVSDEHVAAIKRLQPFDGCDWTGRLRDASNQDKHWALNLTAATGSGHFAFDPPIRKADARLIAEGKVKVQHTEAIEVTLDDGTPVLEWLKTLETEVRSVLEAFQPEFERTFSVRIGRIILSAGPQARGGPTSTVKDQV